MKKTRFIACFVAAALSLSSVPAVMPPVLAADKSASTAESDALKKAITEVKGRIPIPSELEEFKYETNEKYSTVFYKFYWYSKGDSNRYFAGEYEKIDEMITVEYFGDQITAYEYDSPDYNRSCKKGFAKLSAEKQEEFAKKHFKQLNPDLKGNAVITRNTSSANLGSQTVSYGISRSEYGVPMNNNQGNITIDRDTGRLISFNLSWYNDAKPQDASKAISVEKANSLYKERKGLEDPYYSYFTKDVYNKKTQEWETERFVLPVYVPENSGENEIDAITGKYTAYYDDLKKYSYTDAYEWEVEEEADDVMEEEAADDSDYYGSYAGLTDAELEAVQNESSYISKEKAAKIIKDDPYITFNKELVFAYRTINNTYDDDGNTYTELSTSYEYSSEKDRSISLTVNMDANSGEIISFSKYYGDRKSGYSSVVKESSATKTAKEALKHFMKDKAGEYKLDDEIINGITDYSVKPEKVYSLYFTFTRYVNGLPAPFDKVRFEVDANGEVLSFSYSYHNVEFPKPVLVSKDKAYETLFKNMKPDLKYTGFRDLQMRSHVYLTYIYDSSFILNALTGERVNYSGEPYYTEEKVPEDKVIKYTDIKGHKYEKEIQTLVDYGVIISDSDKLRPDDDITVGEFLDLIYSAYDVWEPYSFKTDAERKAYRSRKLTHGEMAKLFILCRDSGSRKAAELKGVYKQPFDDVSEDHPYCGYIALAKAYGYINGKNGKFQPNKGISKGECLKLTYDYFCGDEEKDIYEIFAI